MEGRSAAELVAQARQRSRLDETAAIAGPPPPSAGRACRPDREGTYLLSLDLLAEYHEVVLRPATRRRHGLTDAEVDVVLTELALNGTLLDAAPSTAALPDDGDRHLWALLEATAAAVLVTGDDARPRRAPEPTRVLSPRPFLARL